jgi:hypothetical protein
MKHHTSAFSISSLGFFGIFFATILSFVLLAPSIRVTSEPAEEPLERIPEKEKFSNEILFDTTALEDWCKGADLGTIRMVGAWICEEDNTVIDSNTDTQQQVIEDEQGQAWTIDRTVDENSFLLLWIVDNNTPTDTTDDIILRVWTEVH